MIRRAALLLSLTLAAGCRGTVPSVNGSPELGISSVLIGCRMTLPTGEASDGGMAINLEGQKGGRSSETYRIPAKPRRSLLYQVEPGTYKILPTRNIFGFNQKMLRIRMEGRTYKVPFPRELLRKSTLVIKPTKIVPLGILDVSLSSRLPGRPASLKVRLDDSIEARREIVQTVVRAMMDPNAPAEERTSAIGWTKALEQALSEILTENERGPAFRSVP